MINLKNFPKIELHVHLDGSVKLETAKELLNINGNIEDAMVAPYKCLDLNEYLTKFELPISIMQTKEELIRISKELALELLNDGVIYAEVRFAPINHIKKGLSLEEIVESVLDGFKQIPIKINLILCLMRNSCFLDNKKIIDLAFKYLNKGVCALDLAGAEALYRTSSFKELFEIIEKKEIPFTIHAGEADGVDSMNSACSFGTKRIGHGVRCIESNDTLNLIKDNNITLEICPTSNFQTNVVNSYNNHPIKYLYEKGINVTINTDNRTVSNITLTKEYEKLIETFHFSLEDIKKMNICAIQSSFLTDKEKEILKNNYNKIYNDFINNN